MQAANHYAFKEWAAICEAIVAGRQSIVIRKGGIHERRGDFTIDHREFWLFPTRFHEGSEDLTEEGKTFLARAGARKPAAGFIQFSTYFEVTDIIEIGRETQLPELRPFHVYDDRVLQQRFHYKRPGLTVLVGRASVLEEAQSIPDSPHFGGCRSWVELPTELATAGLKPVQSEEESLRRRQQILYAMSQRAIL